MDMQPRLGIAKIFIACMVKRKMFIGLFLLLLVACHQKKNVHTYASLPDYDFTDPLIVHLKTDLDEISGIAYYPKDTSVFAINDELGVLYKIYVRKQVQIQKWRFSNDDDYEDLVLLDNMFYALQSNGNLKEFTFLSKDSVQIEDHRLPLDGDNEFESLYYDPFHEKLVLLCKDCEDDDEDEVSAYAYNPVEKTFSEDAFFTIDTEKVAKLLNHKKTKFRPSAAAIHPITKDLYILSAVDKSIVIADRNGNVKEAYEIDPRLFKQPEGLTFTLTGDMLISNESAEIGSANILIFKYKPLVHEKG
jgi:uncharacterized protein YjiK